MKVMNWSPTIGGARTPGPVIQRTARAQAIHGALLRIDRRHAYAEYAPMMAVTASSALRSAVMSRERIDRRSRMPPAYWKPGAYRRGDGAVERVDALADPDGKHARPQLGDEVAEHGRVPLGVPGPERAAVVERRHGERRRGPDRDPPEHLLGLARTPATAPK